MDSSASAAVVTAVTTFSADAIELLVIIIPIAMGLLITLALTPKAVKWFRRWVRI